MPIGDSTLTSRCPRTGRFVRTCRGTVLQYVENKVPLALKGSVTARATFSFKPEHGNGNIVQNCQAEAVKKVGVSTTRMLFK